MVVKVKTIDRWMVNKTNNNIERILLKIEDRYLTDKLKWVNCHDWNELEYTNSGLFKLLIDGKKLKFYRDGLEIQSKDYNSLESQSRYFFIDQHDIRYVCLAPIYSIKEMAVPHWVVVNSDERYEAIRTFYVAYNKLNGDKLYIIHDNREVSFIITNKYKTIYPIYNESMSLMDKLLFILKNNDRIDIFNSKHYPIPLQDIDKDSLDNNEYYYYLNGKEYKFFQYVTFQLEHGRL